MYVIFTALTNNELYHRIVELNGHNEQNSGKIMKMKEKIQNKIQ